MSLNDQMIFKIGYHTLLNVKTNQGNNRNIVMETPIFPITDKEK